MKIAIIGAGFTGLAAAFELAKSGHDVTVFEKEKTPGGLAVGFKEKNWQWSIEHYYHHWFANDSAVLNLAKEINYEYLIQRPKTCVYIEGKIYQLDSPLKLLTFPKLNLGERLRMALVLGLLRYNPFWRPLEHSTISEVLPKAMGKRGYEMIWEPQLKNKFGEYFNVISLAWFWARIKKRTPSLVYPTGGFLFFAEKLSEKIANLGGKFVYDCNIEEIKNENNIKIKYSVDKNVKTEEFDKVIVTLSSFTFAKLCPDLPDNYKQKITSLKGLGAMTVMLRLKKQFMTDGTYWLSICEKDAPVTAIVEHTNFMNKKFYNDEHLVYLGNYLPADHPFFSKTEKELLKIFDPILSKINQEYQSNLIGVEIFKTPFAQPIIPINYSKLLPSFETPIENIYLANIQQVYPWDRGTNYAVELGQKIAKIVSS